MVGRYLGAVVSVWGMFQRDCCFMSLNFGRSERDFSKVYPGLKCGVERLIDHGAGDASFLTNISYSLILYILSFPFNLLPSPVG